jgi:ABC-type siderophore export system fused ATPase/permease subunit
MVLMVLTIIDLRGCSNGFLAALPVLTQAAIGFGAVTTVAGIKQAGSYW